MLRTYKRFDFPKAQIENIQNKLLMWMKKRELRKDPQTGFFLSLTWFESIIVEMTKIFFSRSMKMNLKNDLGVIMSARHYLDSRMLTEMLPKRSDVWKNWFSIFLPSLSKWVKQKYKIIVNLSWNTTPDSLSYINQIPIPHRINLLYYWVTHIINHSWWKIHCQIR